MKGGWNRVRTKSRNYFQVQCDNVVSTGQTPQNELQIYTWMDATLKELTGLIKEVNPESRRRGTYFDFAIVYPDLRQGPR